MSAVAIETVGLTRDFDSVRAVDNLSITVAPGTVFGFLGPNGSGKTTTIRLLLGLIPPSEGSSRVLGYDSTTQGDEIRARTGALLEHPGLYERLTAVENLEFFGRIWRLSRDERDRRIRSLLTHLGLWERRDERIGTWSRGMRQKLAIARTLLHQPPLVFLDEPTAGLDPVASASLRQDLADLARSNGVTVFLTTHNLAEAEKLCDAVAVIYNGKLIRAGSTHELLAQVGAKRVSISTSDLSPDILDTVRAVPGVHQVDYADRHLHVELGETTEPRDLVGVLVRAGASVDEVRLERGSLEDAFLSLVSGQHAD